jgi:hypothetical protein
MKRARMFLVMLILLSLLPMAACTSEDVAFVSAMAEEWARAKGINPTNENGDIDMGGAIGAFFTSASRTVGISSGDPEVDAVMTVKETVDSLKKGDKLADEGMKNRDLKKIEEAQKLRKNDFHYSNAAFVVMLTDGTGFAAKKSGLELMLTRAKQGKTPTWTVGAIHRDIHACVTKTLKPLMDAQDVDRVRVTTLLLCEWVQTLPAEEKYQYYGWLQGTCPGM